MVVALVALAITAQLGSGDAQSLGMLFVRVGEAVEISSSGTAHPRWLLVEAVPKDYNNYIACGARPRRGCHQPIEYVTRELLELRGRQSFQLGEAPALASAGTHRLLVTEKPGDVAMTEADIPHLAEIVVRRGDDYLGYLSELLGVPFVFWPLPLASGHQTDRRLAADCSALVVYGRRRMGERVPYVSPRGLFQLARELGAGEPIRAGDVLNYGFQSAVLSRDTAPFGVLNGEDVVLQTSKGVAEERPLRELPYSSHPVRLLRWEDHAAP